MFVGRGTTDPFSGFFAVRREHVEPALKTCAPIGFKLLLDMLMVLKPKSLRVADVPMRFRKRHAGESKLSPMIMYELALMVLRNLISPTLSLRFVSFCLIGGSGVLVHLAVLAACASGAGLAFPVAQSIATVVAMFTNFVLNNFLTYRDRQLKGFGFYVGLAKFFAICSAGAFANVAIASAMYTSLQIGWLLPSMAGIVAGAVWNYALSSRYTWAERM